MAEHNLHQPTAATSDETLMQLCHSLDMLIAKTSLGLVNKESFSCLKETIQPKPGICACGFDPGDSSPERFCFIVFLLPCQRVLLT